jgi:hypothetical protein
MSIYLPFGIALFQANVTQLRSIAEQQELILVRQSSFNGTPELTHQNWVRSLMSWYRRLTQARKSYIFIAIGMIVQVRLTIEYLLLVRRRTNKAAADHHFCDICRFSNAARRLV